MRCLYGYQPQPQPWDVCWSSPVSNECPHEQDATAFGLWMVKPPPISELTKSTVAPPRYIALKLSTMMRTPWVSMTSSPSSAASSIVMPYWSPEQPPGATKTRNAWSGVPCSSRKDFNWATASSEIESIGALVTATTISSSGSNRSLRQFYQIRVNQSDVTYL